MNSLDKDCQAINSAAILIKGIQMAVDRNGMVLLALGLDTRREIELYYIESCTFINKSVIK